MKHIADVLGISAMTVSRALNNKPNVKKKTREEVLYKAHEMGYTPNYLAKSLASDKTNTIGVLIPQISHSFFPQVVKGIEEVLNTAGFQLLLTNSDEQFYHEKKAIRNFRSKRIEGLLISSSQKVKNFSFYKNLINSGIKLVFFDRCIKGIGASSVSVDDRASSKKITTHLIDCHKYKRIAYISGLQDISTCMERLQGYQDALRSRGLLVNDELIKEGGFQEKAGYEAMIYLLSFPKTQYPEAVVTVNDPVAIGAMNAIKDKGLSIPDDIAVVGFTDDIRAPLLDPPLTTVHQPAYKIGKRAAQKIVQAVSDQDDIIENIEVHTTLKIRASCGCQST